MFRVLTAAAAALLLASCQAQETAAPAAKTSQIAPILDTPDAVLDGQTGVVVDGRDLDAVTDAVAALLSDRALRDRMGAAGRAWVETSWRWDVVAARLDELLQG